MHVGLALLLAILCVLILLAILRILNTFVEDLLENKTLLGISDIHAAIIIFMSMIFYITIAMIIFISIQSVFCN
nr:MAG TPA: hypothetical protein [Caudoviricetes sp.]